MKLWRHGAVLLQALLLAGCAGQFPPPGGPVDTEPPRITNIRPAPYTTFFDGDEVTVEFDEYVDRQSAENSVFISPDVGPLEFDWSGSEMTLHFRKALRDATTYVVTIGTDVVDMNNRNRMAQAFTAAFSTGGEVDRGGIEGMIFPRKPEDRRSGVLVFAYRVPPGAPDTLNPETTPPDYITQSGHDGAFAFLHVAFGDYRLFAVRDEYRNLLYDPETDEFGVQSVPVSLTDADTVQRNVLFRLAAEDTTGPRLTAADPLTTVSLRLTFSEPLDTSGLLALPPKIVDTVSSTGVNVLSSSLMLPTFDQAIVETSPLTPGTMYRIDVTGWSDRSGNAMNPMASTFTFAGTDSVDRSAVDVVDCSVTDSSADHPFDGEVVVRFTRSVRPVDAPSFIRLADSSGVEVDAAVAHLTPAVMVVRPAPLRPSTWYVLSIDVGGVRDAFGQKGRDTVRVVRFRTRSLDVLSSIDGTVVDEHATDARGPIVISAEPVETSTEGIPTVTLLQAGPFRFGQIKEGKYVVSAFRDRNANHVFDSGSVFPFSLAERFTVYRDTLTLRARWPLEGLQLKLR